MLLSPDQTRRLFRDAVEQRYAILAVNADSPAAISDCLEAAESCDAPIIIETSLWQLTGRSFGLGDPLLGVDRYHAELKVLGESDRFAKVPVVFHTDHIKGPETLTILRHAIRVGASSISLDSSELSPAENIGKMNALCEFARDHGLGLALEMEAGVDDGVTELGETETLFGQVESRHPGYLALWAPGVGTKHGLGDMGGFSPAAVAVHQKRASEIAGRPIGIALHGSSGLTDGQLQEAVAAGVAKVNWSSESLLIRSQALRDFYVTEGEKLEKGHSDFKVRAMDNGPQTHVSLRYRPKVEARIRVLGGAGRGARLVSSLSKTS